MPCLRMINHMKNVKETLCKKSKLSRGDHVLDIASNDGTLLNAYEIQGLKKIGVDPTAEKFREHYSKDIQLISEFFPSSKLNDFLSENKAKIITSIAMFYDLEDPKDFVK